MNVLVKLAVIGASLAAGTAARKGLERLWRGSTGTEPPKSAQDLQHPLPGVLVFSFATVASAAIIRVLTQRAAAKTTKR